MPEKILIYKEYIQILNSVYCLYISSSLADNSTN